MNDLNSLIGCFSLASFTQRNIVLLLEYKVICWYQVEWPTLWLLLVSVSFMVKVLPRGKTERSPNSVYTQTKPSKLAAQRLLILPQDKSSDVTNNLNKVIRPLTPYIYQETNRLKQPQSKTSNSELKYYIQTI